MKSVVSSLIIAVFLAGCTASPGDKLAADDQGLVEVRVDAASLQAASITRVTVEVAAAGLSQDLVRDPVSGSFSGTLILPARPHSIVARAFSNDVLVGQSQPVDVDVQPDGVTRVMVRILDLTMEPPPVFGPIFDSLTYPTTAQAGASVTLAVSVIAPAGDPVTYSWTSDCPDSTFGSPAVATTTWSKPTQGSCTLTVTATSNGFTVARSFLIVVFASGANSGAVDVNGVFVTQPTLTLTLFGGSCRVVAGSNASCAETIASPGTTTYQAGVISWGTSPPGTLEVSDSCGGRFGMSQRTPDVLLGSWLPPVAGGLCILTVRAVNGDGLTGTMSAAVLTRAGTAPTTQPPRIAFAQLRGCPLTPAVPFDCGPIPAGTQLMLNASMDWSDGQPGSVTVTDSCAGALPAPGDALRINAAWTVPDQPGTICTTTLQATNLQGVSAIPVAAQYHIMPSQRIAAPSRDAP